ncbi:hypothetical protein FJT64_018787 [Amphibalanus amphitrite]|uniref:Uncharacterized protein n=1 Tax=Amphibalanus amphitrite TaxID=1232801 RepID=A0A6A4X6Y4_AMPAM|nr:hypothetical protein FJT64_018787 [Amphibalanus amphitrite]
MSCARRHSDLVRLILGVCGRLTLTGVHQPHPQLGWRIATGAALGCYALLALAVLGAVVLVTLSTRRGCLRRLGGQLLALERLADGRGAHQVGRACPTPDVPTVADCPCSCLPSGPP